MKICEHNFLLIEKEIIQNETHLKFYCTKCLKLEMKKEMF